MVVVVVVVVAEGVVSFNPETKSIRSGTQSMCYLIPCQQQLSPPSARASVYAWIRRRDICQDGRVSLDEFVASFQALIPSDTRGWAAASSSFTAAGGDSTV